MEAMNDAKLVEGLAAPDHRAANEAAAAILLRGERMVGHLLRMKGRRETYQGTLGNPRGAMMTLVPLPGHPLTPAQKERVVTVEAAALYLISAIYTGRADFASSALLVDLAVPPERREGANKAEYVERGFASARAWAEALEKEGLEALRGRGEGPLEGAGLSFW